MDREAAILAVLPKADAMARAFYRRRARLADKEDLICEARLAVVRAFDGFDPNRGKAFSSYAHTRILGALKDLHRREDFLSRADRKRAGHTQNVMTQFAPDGEEEAAGLRLSEVPCHDRDPEEMLLAANATRQDGSQMPDEQTHRRKPARPGQVAEEAIATLRIPERVLDALLVAQPVEEKVKMAERLLLRYAGEP